MAYETRDNTGSLFRNAEKRSENGPDYSGSCKIDGAEYFFDGWIKKSQQGTNWMSFSFKRKDKQPAQPPRTESRAPQYRDDDVPPF
jgi:hypothetical protein